MKKAQFIHVEDYSKKGYGKTTGKYKTEVKQSTIHGVCGEANRVKSFCSHVPVPNPPKLLYGVDLETVEQLTEDYYTHTKITLKNGKKRALRADSDALLAGVVSVPSDFYDWESYKKDTINYLKNKYGHKLKSIIEHTDEPNPHLHFYVIPDNGENFVLIHDGKRAMLESGEKDKKKLMTIYKKAMTEFNDDFYTNVSSKYDLTRKSNTPRPRVAGTTAEYKDAIKQLNELEEKNKNLKSRIEKAQKKGFRAGLTEFEQKNFIAKLNVLNITKKKDLAEANKIIKYNEKRKKIYKEELKNTKKSLAYIEKKQKNDSKLAIKYKKKVIQQKEELEEKYKKIIELDSENKNLKKKNGYLNRLVDAVQRHFKKGFTDFLSNYYKPQSQPETQDPELEVKTNIKKPTLK